ncbi:MAG: type III pantothenate kinase [Bacteroidetes bacterium]|nr:type III pantothenate kinase [Bacteroidota bacterium]
MATHYMVIDLGNTNKKFAVFSNGKLKAIRIMPDITLPNVRSLVKEYPQITHCILSSVISYPVAVKKFLQKKFVFTELDEFTPLPIKNLYKTPATLGKDRLAGAVAGHLRFRNEPVLVITAGSCITYDFINSRGEYLGGSISPGIQMRFLALNTFTGKLPLISGKNRANLTGTTTQESILSGVINGTLAEVEGIISQYIQKNRKLKVILSGGDLNYFDKRLKIKTFAVPNIVIEGLHQILELNAGTIN